LKSSHYPSFLPPAPQYFIFEPIFAKTHGPYSHKTAKKIPLVCKKLLYHNFGDMSKNKNATMGTGKEQSPQHRTGGYIKGQKDDCSPPGTVSPD
jgi:hypothetical protein